MADRNVEIVRALQPSGVDLVAAVGAAAGPFAAMPGSFFAPDFESEFIASDVQWLGPFRGIDGFAAGWRDWLEPWERYEIQTEELIGVGDHVVVFVRVRGRTHRDGVETEHRPAAVWTLRDGMVHRIALYLDRDAALAAAGGPRRSGAHVADADAAGPPTGSAGAP